MHECLPGRELRDVLRADKFRSSASERQEWPNSRPYVVKCQRETRIRIESSRRQSGAYLPDRGRRVLDESLSHRFGLSASERHVGRETAKSKLLGTTKAKGMSD